MMRAVSILGLALLAAGVSACSDEASPAALVPDIPTPAGDAPPAPAEQVGTLSLALRLPGAELDSFSYAITGPGYTKAASIDVSDSNTVSTLVDGIPAGSGYSITLTGSASAPTETTCSGSAAFAITAGEVTEVPVPINCHVQDEATPPVVAASVPLPPLATVALGLLLLAAGKRPRRRAVRAPGPRSP